jgi:hypothetical protein
MRSIVRELCPADNGGLGAHGNRMLRDLSEAGVGVHGFELRERVCVPGRRADQHNEAERRCHWGRNAVRIRDKLQRGYASSGLARSAHFLQQLRASGRIEVVQKIGDQYNVVRSAELSRKGAAV